MDDDLDELLDEVEKKFCSSVSVVCPAPVECGGSTGTCGEDTARQRQRCASTPAQPKTNLSEDIDAFLDEFLDEDSDSPPFKSKQLQKQSRAEKKPPPPSGGRKCCPVFIGGSSVMNGVGTATSQRSCDQLRCTSCDFRVLMFEDYEWDSSCDYLFLRNNMPDPQKLRSRLKRRTGFRAYGCQCSWFSAAEPTNLRDRPGLRTELKSLLQLRSAVKLQQLD